jgi:D-arabinose 1-dehydrogenase-like Zn-dependent alcohol dehydrogenase
LTQAAGYAARDADTPLAPFHFERRALREGDVCIAETQEMLDFRAEADILPDCEMIAIQDINAAHERMERSDVKYRFVIDMALLTSSA